MRFTDFKSPVVLFRLLLGLISVCVVLAIAITVETTGVVDSKARTASQQAELAQLASESSDRLRILTQITQSRIDAALDSPEIADLSEGQQRVVESWLTGDSLAPPTATIANLPVPLSMRDAVQFQEAVDYLRNRLAAILAQTADAGVREAAQDTGAGVEAAILRYYQAPTLQNLHQLGRDLAELQIYTSGEVPQLSQQATVLRDETASTVRLLRWAIVAIALFGGVTVFVLGLYMSRITQRLLAEARTEQDEMTELTAHLEYRNNQLSALYNVFNEITDTLSLRYVVKATMFESLKIMRADMVVLRILRGSDLEVAGAMTSNEQQIEGLPTVRLGEGPTGRTAKRGRTLRINEGGEQMMAPPDAVDIEKAPSRQTNQVALLESGLIVPLIVGARVVGTIACWSRQVSAFNENDERILEMMGSQVATAIVAADTTETSERRAHQDPLTSLPNRRQLDEDIQGELGSLDEDGRHAVVAMVDIDNFKRFNDDYGHRVGDVTLQKVAAVLKSAARDNDHVYRYGGEEFVIVFTDSRPGDARALAERVRLAVEAAPISGENLEPVGPVTVSVGLALLPEHGTDLSELISLADRAMYKAKLNGRNRVEVWDGNEPPAELPSVA